MEDVRRPASASCYAGTVDRVARVVGRRRTELPFSGRYDTRANSIAWRRAVATPFVPKGVYRFRTHEEADAWLWKMITRRHR